MMILLNLKRYIFNFTNFFIQIHDSSDPSLKKKSFKKRTDLILQSPADDDIDNN